MTFTCASEVDANVLPDFCWRALSFRRPHSASDESGVIESTAGLLICLAQYDHRTARLLAEPMIAEVATGQLAGGALSDYVAFYTTCVIDPRRAVEMSCWPAVFVSAGIRYLKRLE